MISVITPTHDPKYLQETWESLKKQAYQDFEWVVVPNGNVKCVALEDDPRIRVVPYSGINRAIGAIKAFAFAQGQGDVLVELDHDDLLTPNALAEIAFAFEDENVDFVYSDCADFSPTQRLVTYHDPQVRKAWEGAGWKFRNEMIDGKDYIAPFCWEPSALALSLIYYAPNHVRAWRSSFYLSVGGHDSARALCDDHELLIRTFLHGHMERIPKVLYLYRVETNTWSSKVDEIRDLSYDLKSQNLHRLVERECDLRGWLKIDLGGGFDSPKGWAVADLEKPESDNVWIQADLRKRWPFEDNSVGVFRAFDLLEHLPDKQHTISEIYRCLKPGGWLLSQTPSALGAGGFCDPTHVSYWVRRSFEYYTDRNVARYIRNKGIRFMVARLFENFPSDWHKTENLSYITADLVKLDGEVDSTLPGIKNI